MSDAIERADIAEDAYMDAVAGSGRGDSEDRIRVILDAATADVEAMARVLHADDCADEECDGGEMAHYERQAQALRDWMLGNA